MNMRNYPVYLILSLIVLISLPLSAAPVPTEDVSLAMKTIVITAGVTRGAALLTPPLIFEEAQLEQEEGSSLMSLRVSEADIGAMRAEFLSRGPPEIRPMGFFGMLMQSVTSLFPDYFMIRQYLEQQYLYPGDIILTGHLEAERKGDYPFRYEGSGSFQVSGSRIQAPFLLDFTYMIPLEGPSIGSIIPLSVTADGDEYLQEAKKIFNVR